MCLWGSCCCHVLLWKCKCKWLLLEETHFVTLYSFTTTVYTKQADGSVSFGYKVSTQIKGFQFHSTFHFCRSTTIQTFFYSQNMYQNVLQLVLGRTQFRVLDISRSRVVTHYIVLCTHWYLLCEDVNFYLAWTKLIV